LKISIITSVYNSSQTIEECINSVSLQTYPIIEHIIIDGGSTNETLKIIREYAEKNKNIMWISEKDEGIYDALNKGIRIASGEIIGILHSDDIFATVDSISKVVEIFKNEDVDCCYSDLIYVDRKDVNKVIRYWKAGEYKREKFKFGWMPPHTTFFCKKCIYEKYGLLNTDLPLAADYELMLRFIYKYNVRVAYIPEVLVKMRYGGTSRPGIYTIGSIIENYKAWKINELRYPITMLLKPFSKIGQFLKR